MASRDKKDLNLVLATAYDLACIAYKKQYPTAPQPFLTCTHRSNAEQEELYAQGRNKKGQKVTNARAGQSAHNYNPAPAFDIGFITLAQKLDWGTANFKNFADIIKKIEPKIVWGGDFKSLKDAPHFELQDWKNYVTLIA